jgi:hypothetical protein
MGYDDVSEARDRMESVAGPSLPLASCNSREVGMFKRLGLLAVVALALMVVVPTAAQAAANTGFGFNARDIRGFPTGVASLTGGGAFDASSGFVHSAGGFSCLEDVLQGPLSGCLAGEGVRWDTVELLPSTTFKCTGAAGEMLKTATTDDTTVVLQADFYRAGDGIDESFTGQMIVSSGDIAPDLGGTQNVWIQGVGCGTAIVHFRA